MNEGGDDSDMEDVLESYFDEETGQWISRVRIRGVDENEEDKPLLKGANTRAKEQGKVDYLAATLGIPKKQAGAVIHKAKAAGGLRGQQNLKVGKKGELSYGEEDLTEDV